MTAATARIAPEPMTIVAGKLAAAILLLATRRTVENVERLWKVIIDAA